MEAPDTTLQLLASCLRSGRHRIGQIILGSDFTLRHAADEGRNDLVVHTSPADARVIARYDEGGNFRPLKTAPNLKRGWLLEAGSLEGMELALEFFYPAALGMWLSQLRGKLHPTSLRETLDRQTGMYRITQLLREDQASELVGRCCTSEGGCLRTILWDLAPGHPITSLPASKLSLEELPPDRIPLLCRELCNLVVAAARPIAKGNLPKKE
jgi:sirohydrochlorin cobaltochelatase